MVFNVDTAYVLLGLHGMIMMVRVRVRNLREVRVRVGDMMMVRVRVRSESEM